MKTYKTINTDPFLGGLKNNTIKIDDLNKLPSQEFISSFSLNLAANSYLQQEIDAVDGKSYIDYDFAYHTDDKVNITETVNYNASLFYEYVADRDVRTLPISYFDNGKSVFTNPALFGDAGNQIESQKLSLPLSEQVFNPAYIFKDQLPCYVSFSFYNNLDHDFFDWLSSTNPAPFEKEGMIATADRVGLTPETIHTTEGVIDLNTANLNAAFIDNIPENSDDWGISFINNMEIDTTNDDLVQSNELQANIGTIEKEFLKTRAMKFSKEYGRDYWQLADKKRPSTQVMMYRIDKFLETNLSTPVQTFYVPSNGSFSNYVDSQIIFGKTYIYKIYGIFVINATKYEYTKTVTGPYAADVTINFRNQLTLIEIPITEKQITISAFPPPPPEISFLNHSNNLKKMRFYFEAGLHEKRETFVPVLESDTQAMLFSKKDNDGNTIFKYSEEPLNYQIFKMNQRPSSIDDFKNNFFDQTINSTLSNSENYEIFLTSNRKYYFMFRTINEFRLISNPSPVYEVELVQDSDETNVVVKAIDFHKEESKSTRSFGRFLKIYPSFDQAIMVDQTTKSPKLQIFDNTNQINNVMLGTTDNPIWGRKFKFRVKSNNTGKTIDINVNFDLIKKLSEEDFS